MALKHSAMVAAVAIFMGGCGGDSSDPAPGNPDTTPGPAKPDAYSVFFTQETLSDTVSAAMGDQRPFLSQIEFTNINGTGTPAWLRAKVFANATMLESFSPLPTESGTYPLILFTPPVDTTGQFDAFVMLDVCTDALCENVIAVDSNTQTIHLEFYGIPGWDGLQGSASHTGYVPIWATPTNIHSPWSWQRPPHSEPLGAINPVASQGGTLYLSYDIYHGDASVLALDTHTGDPRWETELGNIASLSGPALDNGQVYVTEVNNEGADLIALSRDAGEEQFRGLLDAQWPNWLPPTIYDGVVYQGGGTYGGEIVGFDTITGNAVFDVTGLGGVWDMYTVAAGENGVYHSNGGVLYRLSTDATGSVERTVSMSSPEGSFSGFDAPMVIAPNVIGAYAGEASSGRASGSQEHKTARHYAAYDIENETVLWQTDRAYLTHPATRDGVVYIAGNNPATLDAIDADNGEVLWSWTIPPEWNDTSFHRNTLVTDNMVLVSTDKQIVGIGLDSNHGVLFQHNEPGMLAMGDDRVLLLSPGAEESTGSIRALVGW